MCDKKTKLCYQVDNAIQVYQAVLRIQVELTQIRIQPLRKNRIRPSKRNPFSDPTLFRRNKNNFLLSSAW